MSYTGANTGRITPPLFGTEVMMDFIQSSDGTRIAYEQAGTGPLLIVLGGAFNDRTVGIPLMEALAPTATVLTYDRRGRGASSDAPTYAIEREIADLAALIAHHGGTARVIGYSSGAILALRAVAAGLPITGVVLYEPPPTGRVGDELAPQLAALLAADQRGAAVELFQTVAVGLPATVVADLRHAPFRPALEAIAHTLVYDTLLLAALPDGLLAAVTIPTLVLAGDQSHPIMAATAQALAAAIPQGQYQLLVGEGHGITPAVVAPLIHAFFSAAA
ncbi:alpha/beta hydrolase fold (plasmid) [Herpetosiphon aurantiacus DSM 785]|uniref:Alpha/beta hydrolase fold n=1 Tax=Herpetosiphon aurantiacus (strain ATCC 23779 / DSM 785 / 114-95) TaxID=316274 RepID=A9B9B4_HERA2|nr:alpha/beta hydrolase fold [Herpetosiphon aurantiacus DSM 785]